jgi:tRNA(Ile)-lysidine synthase
MTQTLMAALQQLQLPWQGKTLIVAASAGPDSMALLDMARQLTGAKVIAAHFDHQLHPDSHRETQLLQAYCRAHQLTCLTAKWPRKQQPKAGIEAAARTARYRFLDQVCQQNQADYLLTAHHGDDLLENILLKLLRSGYPREMNGLHPVSQRPGYLLVRPLLSWSKADLAKYDRERQIEFVTDQTNFEPVTLRNQLRLEIVPALKKFSPDLLRNANRFAEAMSQLEAERAAYFANFPLAKDLLPGVLLAPKTPNPDYYAWLVEQRWQRQVNFNHNWNQHEFAVQFYQQQAFVSNKQQLPALTQNRQPIKVDEPFVFAGRTWLLSTSKNDSELDYFYGPVTAHWFAGSLQAGDRLQTAAGLRVKPKKFFQVPASLRPLCLGIFNGKQPWFVQGTYRWQKFSKSYIRYSVQALLK